MSIDVSINTSVDCRSTYQLLCQSRLCRHLTDSQLRIHRVSVESRLSLYQYVGNTHHYILVADSRPMVGRYFANGSPTYHRHLANITADTSVDMSLHTSVEWRSSMPTVSREPATSILTDIWPALDYYSLSVDSWPLLCRWITERSLMDDLLVDTRLTVKHHSANILTDSRQFRLPTDTPLIPYRYSTDYSPIHCQHTTDAISTDCGRSVDRY